MRVGSVKVLAPTRVQALPLLTRLCRQALPLLADLDGGRVPGVEVRTREPGGRRKQQVLNKQSGKESAPPSRCVPLTS